MSSIANICSSVSPGSIQRSSVLPVHPVIQVNDNLKLSSLVIPNKVTFTTPSVVGSPRDCENGSWWFHPSGSGHQPWQHILQEETAFPIAYTILAFERPDQVSELWMSCPHLMLTKNIH
ncbi:unnamed protein product [Mesocestoides corti]|uniref:Uncharacterized protein n=1 Tax=Mesocestoides corti TaxID=53468 RepID=A0A0R3URC1_MESCO|nr:unnamed protein product [Mesocestoides corti]